MVGGASPLHNEKVYIRSGGSFSPRTLVYRENGLNPPGGYIYGKDDYSGPTGNHFSILRQGRFLYYAYNELADYYYTGKVHFFNLVARMNKY